MSMQKHLLKLKIRHSIHSIFASPFPLGEVWCKLLMHVTCISSGVYSWLTCMYFIEPRSQISFI